MEGFYTPDLGAFGLILIAFLFVLRIVLSHQSAAKKAQEAVAEIAVAQQKERERLESLLNDFSERYNALSERYRELEASHKELETQLVVVKDQSQSSMAEFKALTEKMRMLEAEIGSLRTERQTLEQAVASERRSNLLLQEKLQSANERISVLEKQVAVLSNENDILRSVFSRLGVENGQHT